MRNKSHIKEFNFKTFKSIFCVYNIARLVEDVIQDKCWTMTFLKTYQFYFFLIWICGTYK